MITRFRSLSADETLGQAVDELLAGSQQDFPVTDHDEFRGMLSRQALVKGLREDGPGSPISNWISQEAQPVGPGEPLVETMDTMRSSQVNAVPVFENGDLVGLLCSENISELLMVRSATDGRLTTGQTPAVPDAA